jgi:hypothetical protein
MTNEVSFISQAKEFAPVVQNVVLALCAIATVIIAYLGLTTWRKERKGKSEYAKAKEVLKAVYKVSEGFKIVRSPVIYTYEYPEEMRDEDSGHLKKGYQQKGTSHVYQERWKHLSGAFEELENQALDAQVEWGAEFKDAMVPLRSCRVDLQVAIQRLLESKADSARAKYLSDEEWERQQSILYHIGGGSHDSFTPEVDAAISLFERKLRPLIKK